MASDTAEPSPIHHNASDAHLSPVGVAPANATPSDADSPQDRSPADTTSADKKRKRSPSPSSEQAQSTPDAAPPLPDEAIPPLPNEAPPGQQDDGWEPIWDPHNQAFYFYNRFTQATQWENPRVPSASASSSSTSAIPAAPGTSAADAATGSNNSSSLGAPPGISDSPPRKRPHGGYNPAIHGDYDPTADYALTAAADEEEEAAAAQREAYGAAGTEAGYAATGQFNRFTGRWQAGHVNPDQHSDESKSRRQLNAFFDVDAAANSHDGRSLKAERQGKKLSKKEIKAFQQKRREKKEEKRRAWLRD